MITQMPAIKSEMVQVHVFRRRYDGEAEYLLIRRSPDEQIFPNLWQMVTGYIEQGESAAEAAAREMREETNLVPTKLWAVPYVASFFHSAIDAVQLIPVFAAEVDADAGVVLSHEHCEFLWLPYEEALKFVVFPSHRIGLETLHATIVAGEHRDVFHHIS